MRWLLLVLLVAPIQAQELRFPYTFVKASVEIQVINCELTSDGKYFLVHCRLRSLAREPLRVAWRELFRLQTPAEQWLGPNYDAGVDRGGGLTRTYGDFELKPREKVNLLVAFALAKDELPARLEADGKLSKPMGAPPG
ncbi:MAG: hypothetical protein AB7S38_02765 [Vulcanimicrobiota bacterium]